MTRLELEQLTVAIGKGLAKNIPPGISFTLILADFGDDGNMAYASNAQRADNAKMLREMADNLENDK